MGPEHIGVVVWSFFGLGPNCPVAKCPNANISTTIIDRALKFWEWTIWWAPNTLVWWFGHFLVLAPIVRWGNVRLIKVGRRGDLFMR